MKIEKISNTSYRLRKMCQGQTYTVILDFKPTQREAALYMAQELQKAEPRNKATFEKMGHQYIKDKSMLSPATLKAYGCYINSMPEWFKEMRMDSISAADIQRLVSWYCTEKSVKYAKNVNGLISAVFSLYSPTFYYKVNYPKVSKKDAKETDYIPTNDDVRKILEEAKGTKWEVPLMLCAFTGLRRGELYALTIDDITTDSNGDNWLTINKDVVIDSSNSLVTKPPKTKKSVRTIYLPKDIAEKIRAQGFITDGGICGLYDYLQKVQRKLEIPRFKLHALRHYYCTELTAQGVSEADILKLGGWSTDNVMKTVYRHSQIDRNLQANKTAQSTLWKSVMEND